jgi:hypothetical protein
MLRPRPENEEAREHDFVMLPEETLLKQFTRICYVLLVMTGLVKFLGKL